MNSKNKIVFFELHHAVCIHILITEFERWTFILKTETKIQNIVARKLKNLMCSGA